MGTRPVFRLFWLLLAPACLLVSGMARAQGDDTDNPFTRPPTFDANTSQVVVDRDFDVGGTLPLNGNVPLSAFTINATLELPQASSLVRFVLEDSAGHEHLVYEAYPVLSGSNKLELKSACEETCALSGITATALKIQVFGAKATLTSVELSTYSSSMPTATIVATAQSLKARQDKFKVTSLNANIAKQGLRWTAGATAISAMSYAEKRTLFGGLDFLPNLQGFEFYRSGIFDVTPGFSAGAWHGDKPGSHRASIRQMSGDYPDTWDWRSAYGGNWVTPVKNQAQCGSCWAFGAVAALETSINLYYNQHLDMDLSEQDMVSCAGLGGCSGALPSDALAYIQANGIADNSCFPYQGYEVSCGNKCSDWQSHSWKVTSYGTPDTDDATLKQTIYHKGVIGFGIMSWSHEMAAVGYQPDTDNPGQTVWRIKNSWGANWGDKGYTTMTVDENDRAWDVYVEHPFPASNPDQYQVACVDEGNGQCYWGLSPTKPASCPATCKN